MAIGDYVMAGVCFSLDVEGGIGSISDKDCSEAGWSLEERHDLVDFWL